MPDQTVERDWRQAMPPRRAGPEPGAAALVGSGQQGPPSRRQSPHPLRLAARRRKVADSGRVSCPQGIL